MEKHRSSQLNQIAFFASLCLFLSVLEYAVPKPLPFMRLGLANLPILLSVKKMPARDTVLLILLKVLLQATVSGTLFSYVFLFSCSGSFASGITILLLYNICGRGKFISNAGLSLAGALANNMAQLLCARFILFGENTRYIAPLLLSVGLVTALALGIFANLFEAKSVWFSEYSDKFPSPARPVQENQSRKHIIIEGIRFACLFAAMLAMFFTTNICILWLCVLVFFLLSVIRRKGKIKILPPLVITASVTFFALLSPSGKILASLGTWRITAGALANGLRRSGILVGMTFVSQNMVSRSTALPGTIGRLFSQVFMLFDELTAQRLSLRPGQVIALIDKRLTEIYTKYLQKLE